MMTRPTAGIFALLLFGLTLLGAPTPGEVLEDAPIEVVLWGRAPSAAVAIEWIDGEGQPLESTDLHLEKGQPRPWAPSRAPVGDVRSAHLVTEGYWTPGLERRDPARDSASADEEPLGSLLEIFETRRLAGSLVLPQGKEAAVEKLEIEWTPDRDRFRAGSASGARVQPLDPSRSIRATCEIDAESASFECPVAVFNSLPLRLLADGWAPVLVWDPALRSITEGRAIRIDPVVLVEGATLFGELDLAGARLEDGELEGLVASVVPSHLRDAVIPEKVLAESPEILRAPVLEEGFFEISGIPEGRCFLTLEGPGFSSYHSPDLEVKNGSITDLGQIRLLPSLPLLRVSVDPPSPPGGGFWTVDLAPESPEVATQKLSAETDRAGVVELEQVGVGLYELKLSEGRSIFHREKVEIRRGEDSLEIVLDAIRLQGELLLGGLGLAANIELRSEEGRERIAVSSNEDGLFEISLPRPGSWNARVDSEALGWIELAQPIEVIRGSEQIVLELPGGAIDGRLELEGPEPEPARISLLTEGRARAALVDASPDGTFQIFGIASGRYWIRAETETAKSKWQPVEVEENSAPTAVDLVLERARQVDIEVVLQGSGVPIPRAVVTIFPETEVGTPGDAQLETADHAGRLSFETDADAAMFLVQSEKSTLFLTRSSMARLGSGVLRIEVPPGPGGSLALRQEPPADLPAGEVVEAIRIRYGDGSLKLKQIVSPATIGPLPDGRMALKNLAPGNYEICVHWASGMRCGQVQIHPLSISELDFLD